MHSHFLVHRDIKPDNFALGIGNNAKKIYIFDFGLTVYYRDPKTKLHFPFRENRGLTGTPRYASINSHLGNEQSRRDDMESLGYCLLYLVKGKLPWQGLHADIESNRIDKVKDIKMKIPVEVLCEGLPKPFEKYIRYCRALKYEDEPHYPKIRAMFKDLSWHLQNNEEVKAIKMPTTSPKEEKLEGTTEITRLEEMKTAPTDIIQKNQGHPLKCIRELIQIQKGGAPSTSGISRAQENSITNFSDCIKARKQDASSFDFNEKDMDEHNVKGNATLSII